MMFQQFDVTIYVVEMNEWECGLYTGAGNRLTFAYFCDKNTGVRVICGVGYSPENTVPVHRKYLDSAYSTYRSSS